MSERREITNEDLYAALVAILSHLVKEEQSIQGFKNFVGSANAIDKRIENIKRQLQSVHDDNAD